MCFSWVHMPWLCTLHFSRASIVKNSSICVHTHTHTCIAILNFLLGVFARYPNSPMGERALEMVVFTLKAMANEGMHDHVGQVRLRVSGKL